MFTYASLQLLCIFEVYYIPSSSFVDKIWTGAFSSFMMFVFLLSAKYNWVFIFSVFVSFEVLKAWYGVDSYLEFWRHCVLTLCSICSSCALRIFSFFCKVCWGTFRDSVSAWFFIKCSTSSFERFAGFPLLWIPWLFGYGGGGP